MHTQKAGLTLLELLTAVALAGLIAGLGIPTLNGIVDNARRTAATNDLIAAIQVARTTAIRRNRQVVICPLGNEPCGADARWSNGWMVFVNESGELPPRPNSNAQVVHRHDQADSLQITSNRNYYAFHRIGLRSTNGTLVLCDRRGAQHARAVIVSYTGRPRVARKRANGAPLAC